MHVSGNVEVSLSNLEANGFNLIHSIFHTVIQILKKPIGSTPGLKTSWNQSHIGGNNLEIVVHSEWIKKFQLNFLKKIYKVENLQVL